MLKRKRWVLGATVVAAAMTCGGVLSASGTPSESSVAGWPRQIGGSGDDYANTVLTTSSGDVYVAGSTNGSVGTTPNQGGYDIWLARFDRYGKLKWVQQFGTASDDDAASLVAVGSSIYLTGLTYGSMPGNSSAGGMDTYVARFDSSGTLKWIRQFGSSGTDEPLSITALGGSLWVVGATDGALPGLTPLGNGDGFLMQMSTSGTVKSTRLIGTDQYDYPIEVVATGRSLIIAGTTEGAFLGQTNAGGSDGFVMSISNINTKRESTWVRQLGTSSRESIESVTVAGRTVYAVGSTRGAFPGESNAGGVDTFVVRYSTSGTYGWLQQFGTAGDEQANQLAANSSGVFVAGTTDGSFPGFASSASEGFASKFSSTGVQDWTRQFGTSAADGVEAIAIRSSDNYGGKVVVAGWTGGTVWGQVSAGNVDALIATFLS